MIFDHIVLIVSNLKVSKKFYTDALCALGFTFIKEEDDCVGFGKDGKASFWICSDGGIQKPMHIGFVAPDRKAVDEFYAAGILAGGRDNGQPGLRAYHPNYYAAFVYDPDGHNIEAVCRRGD